VSQFLGESKLNNRQTVKGNLQNKAFRDLPQEITKLPSPIGYIFCTFLFLFSRCVVAAFVSPYLRIFEYLISFLSFASQRV